jgi:hypothetical protein
MTDKERMIFDWQIPMILKHHLGIQPQMIKIVPHTYGHIASAIRDLGLIEFEMQYVNDSLYHNKKADMKKTLLHELLHFVHPGGHTKAFRKHTYALGLRSYGDRTWKWKYECSCGWWIKVHKRTDASYCRHCGKQYKKPVKLL